LSSSVTRKRLSLAATFLGSFLLTLAYLTNLVP
jgi:hypothetical protein